MSDKKILKQDDRVYFKLGDGMPEGWASIAGVQGFVVIIKPEQPLKLEKDVIYPYSHIYIVDTQIIDPPVEKV